MLVAYLFILMLAYLLMLKIGHRGAGKEIPENTIASFNAALDAGMDAVELDVRRTKDGKLIVFHDEKMKRLTGAGGSIGDYTLAELERMKVLGSDYGIPTLDEVLDAVGDKAKSILIEIKEVGTEKAIVDTVKKHMLAGKVIIVSFHEEALKAIKEFDKDISTGLIYASYKSPIYNNPIDAAKALGAEYLLPLYRFTHTKNVEDAHKNGLKVIVWTIDDREAAKEFKNKGVDGIATDYPEILEGL